MAAGTQDQCWGEAASFATQRRAIAARQDGIGLGARPGGRVDNSNPVLDRLQQVGPDANQAGTRSPAPT